MGKLFQVSVEKKYLKELNEKRIDENFNKFLAYFGNKEQQERIRNLKEEQYQEGFLRDLFVKILGYTLNPKEGWNLTTELKNVTGSKKADGAIMKNDEAIAVIELKSTSTTNLEKVEEQAFNYKNHHPNCKYVITSNFEKLRFYIQNAVDHEEFDLFNMTKEDFALLWLCLAKDNIFNDLPLKVKDASIFQEEKVTDQLYKDYSMFREQLFLDILENNPDKDKLLLFKKTQKLLDRFLFIFFAEDRFLLPPNSISKIIEQWEQQAEWGDDVTLYQRFKKYFTLLNKGWKGKEYEIFPYNGGLFLQDELLESIKIGDEVLKTHTMKLSAYNFNPDTSVKAGEEKVVDVNILGHIFEHSIGEIESVQAEIKGEKVEKQKSKRKKHGIYYTPKYITKYIVENTVGKLCREKYEELGIVDEDYAKGRKNRKKTIIKALDEKLNTYREWLLSLTICDPACGSGAFLNQALDFLMEEHRKIDELRAQLFGEGVVFPDITNDILEKNLYGVDLNEESVEIAKLSLWLRTAKKGRKLNTLSNNIKCGDSLIDDPDVAGDKAFKWEEEFPEVFGKRKNKAYHVTFALHNSRYAITDGFTRQLEPGFVAKTYPELREKEQELLAEVLREAAEEYKLNILEINICHDHVHALIACGGNELESLTGKWKGRSAYLFNRRVNPAVSDKQAVYSDGTKEKFWAKGYYSKIVVGEKQFQSTVDYIRNNRAKHDLPPATNKLNRLLAEMRGKYGNTMIAGDRKGFDVIIGNPPYVKEATNKNAFDGLHDDKCYQGKMDLWYFFGSLAIEIIKKEEGLIGYIAPNNWITNDGASKFREYFFAKWEID